MTNFYTADHHFGHANILGYCDRNEFLDVHDMNRVMIERWNQVIKPGDVIYYAGDLCFPSHINIELLLASLNSSENIIFIKGNHDKTRTLKYFHGYHQSHPVKVGKYNCILNHRPVYPKGMPDPFNDHDKSIDPDQYDFILSGHIHQLRYWTGKSFNLSLELHDYYPYSEEELIAILDYKFNNARE